jgi:hypothetical protein
MFPIVLTGVDEPINLQNFPAQLANALGIPIYAAGLLATIIIMTIFLIPVLFVTKRIMLPALMTALLSLIFGVALGWISYWILIVLAIGIALMFANQMRGWLTGQGGGN